jgi:hypothetical protein
VIGFDGVHVHQIFDEFLLDLCTFVLGLCPDAGGVLVEQGLCVLVLDEMSALFQDIGYFPAFIVVVAQTVLVFLLFRCVVADEQVQYFG